jgi:hypothetical protein
MNSSLAHGEVVASFQSFESFPMSLMSSPPEQVATSSCRSLSDHEPPPAKGALRPLGHSLRSGGQLRPSSYAGSIQLRPEYLRVRRHSSALFQGSHRTLPFERPALSGRGGRCRAALRRSECFDSRSSGISCPSSGPRLVPFSNRTAGQGPTPPAQATPVPSLSLTAVPE